MDIKAQMLTPKHTVGMERMERMDLTAMRQWII
jgi:hypothetical protein